MCAVCRSGGSTSSTAPTTTVHARCTTREAVGKRYCKKSATNGREVQRRGIPRSTWFKNSYRREMGKVCSILTSDSGRLEGHFHLVHIWKHKNDLPRAMLRESCSTCIGQHCFDDHHPLMAVDFKKFSTWKNIRLE